ncbi:MAG: translation initiation factor IF-2 [Chloroflexi bacterium RIFCSPLOWO2_12_FULL_71_12]|nr:MAG: translation initiation factor IF-2 [Chloroflexi bacterium GWC2_70_10]OGO70205.1 MAG: translation initiation factor IF-2 [Chloroflexi bacterium RIFCSPLOWO2_02_FULL_71_16]OGO73680.1 MAG: translation initiation factor IF-2 [Chloroflexi bacterium RIFCSPLOWO2_12_FULL_71_12]
MQAPAPVAVLVPEGRGVVTLPRTIQVGELAKLFELSVVDVIRALVNLGLMVTINQTIDYDTAALVAGELGIEVAPEEEAAEEPEATAEETSAAARPVLWTDDDPARLKPRAPVVTILGHVDHGKTSLLDAIRQTNITSREAGGITQHIGAYQIEHHGRRITWIDTPGHEAFTAMRARGASVTDIAVLVVAADDGVQPQTVEAISHVRAAGVPMVVALNKIDKSDADPERVKGQLAEQNVTVEDYGGDVPLVPVSARTKQGLDDLLDVIGLVADLKDLRADPERPAIGRVVEAHLERGRGPVATVLVQTGTLARGDIVVAGTSFGRVRAMVDDRGKTVNRAEPSRPVEILGLPDVPEAGDIVRAVPDEKTAKALVEEEQRRRAAGAAGERPATLDEMFAQVKEGKAKELRVVLKADVQGSLEAIRSSLAKLPQDEVALNIIHAAVGDVSESDANLAGTSSAVILAFSNKVDVAAKRAAEQLGVDLRQYKVIYELIEDVQKALVGLLEPEMVEQVLGHAEVRQTFTAGKTTIAGSAVLDGVMRRGVQARVMRGGSPVHDGRIGSLKRFKDDAREVTAGLECGITLESFNEVAVGDIIEAYVITARPRTA